MLSRFALPDGYELAVDVTGEGRALLLVHGSLSDYRAWAAQMAAFPDRRVLAVSLRHCYPGRFEEGAQDFTVASHARDLAHLIEQHLGAPVDLVGHSRGGAVALQLALHCPELLRTLVLADPGGLEALLPDSPDGRRMAAESSLMFERLREDLKTRTHEEAAQRFAEALGGPGAWERRTPAQRQMTLDNIATGPACAERPTFSPNALAELAVPTLLVTGERSPPRYALALAALQRLCPNVRGFNTVPDAAHAMQRENAPAFNRLVSSFLDAALPKAPPHPTSGPESPDGAGSR